VTTGERALSYTIEKELGVIAYTIRRPQTSIV
jgi:hypothetical protein